MRKHSAGRSLLNIAEELPDWTGNTFGAHNDLMFLQHAAKRLQGKAGTKDDS